MESTKADIVAALQKQILSLQGFKTSARNKRLDDLLRPIKNAFPNAVFPLAAMHEFISSCPEDTAATSGFISALVSALMQEKGTAVWINAAGKIFPPALQSFGIAAERIIFINLKKEKQILWVMEEALKCKRLAAVIAELPELDFTASRRLQLAVEQSQVPGFILRCQPKSINTTACVSRWQIKSLSSELADGMPGLGFPRWNIDLLKIRNGKPGSWQVEFAAGRFRHINKFPAIEIAQQKQAV
ncbi:MAG: Error-prone repair protein ImuA [Ferruginibacter sp.]|nr:Error-prone repair protein ImuA [Ferruginibacter sp.]